jgi:hypothetical protein
VRCLEAAGPRHQLIYSRLEQPGRSSWPCRSLRWAAGYYHEWRIIYAVHWPRRGKGVAVWKTARRLANGTAARQGRWMGRMGDKAEDVSLVRNGYGLNVEEHGITKRMRSSPGQYPTNTPHPKLAEDHINVSRSDGFNRRVNLSSHLRNILSRKA